MKKGLLPIMILCGLWPNVKAQPRGGFGQYYYMGANRNFSVVPVGYFQSSNKWYAEGRYNYEALNTLSIYGGKTFEKKAVISYTVSPILGVLFGQLNGGSAGVNLQVDYKRLSFNTQSQYTFSVQQRNNSFVYSWSDLTYQFLNRFAAGISLQQTKLHLAKEVLEKGLLLKTVYKSWTFPLYIFTPESSERYFVLGINYEWQRNNSDKNSIRQPD